MGERLEHILSSRQFDMGFLIHLFRDAMLIMELLKTRDGRELLTHVLPGYVICEIFWQESSRTLHSFASAGARLGASVFHERGIKKKKNGKTVWELVFSSAMKDAYFEDEVRAWASCYDALILRTAESGLVARAADICDEFGYDVHFINAGDGPDGEHPTQTLGDIASMAFGLGLDFERDFSKFKNYSIAFLNDIERGRTIHSLAPVCGDLGMTLKFIPSHGNHVPRNLLDELERKKYKFEIHSSLTEADIFYVTRHQAEYGNENLQGFSIDKKTADKYGVKLVMHPFPRTKKGNELPIWRKNDLDSHGVSMDKDPRAMYFKQMELGVSVRMALLKHLLNPNLDFKKLREEKLIRGLKSQCICCNRMEYQELGWTENSPACGYIQTIPHIFCPRCEPNKPSV